MSTDTTTTTENTTAKAKAPRKPRDKKTVSENTVLAATTGTAVTAATLALCVLVTLPPKEKFEAGLGYWQIEIADQQGQRYSNIYRTKALDRAKAIADKIAHDRHLPIITKEPPAPRAAVEQPAPADVPDDHFQAPNFTDVGDLSDLEPDPMPF